MKLDQDQIETFRQSGCLLFASPFSAAEVELLRAGLPRLLAYDGP